LINYYLVLITEKKSKSHSDEDNNNGSSSSATGSHSARRDGEFSGHHSALMNELINSNNSPGPGIDISFNVIQWSAAAAAVARSQRRTTNHLTNSGYNDVVERDRFNAATAVIKRVPATAKLQEMAISFLPGP